jgi:hypothetical protein
MSDSDDDFDMFGGMGGEDGAPVEMTMEEDQGRATLYPLGALERMVLDTDEEGATALTTSLEGAADDGDDWVAIQKSVAKSGVSVVGVAICWRNVATLRPPTR